MATCGAQPQTVEIGLEAIGHYWLAVYSYLHDKGYKIHVSNPIQTDGWRRGTEIRRRKTDVIDSLLIAELTRYGDFVEARLPNEVIYALKQLSRFRSYLIGYIGDLKRKFICVLDQVFPEYQSVFSEVFGKTSKEILLQFATPVDIENVTADTLAELLAALSRKWLGREDADRLSSATTRSFGVTFCRDSFSFQLRMLIEQIKCIES